MVWSALPMSRSGKAPPCRVRPAARTTVRCPRAAACWDWQTNRVSSTNPARDASWRSTSGAEPVRVPRVNASVQWVAIQECGLPCGHAHTLTPASPSMRPRLSSPAVAAELRGPINACCFGARHPDSLVCMQHTHARSTPECTPSRCQPNANFVAQRWQRPCTLELESHRHLERARITTDVAGRVVDDGNLVHLAVRTPALQIVDVIVPVEGVDQVDAHVRAERVVDREVLGGLQVEVAVTEDLAADQEAAIAGREDADRLIAAAID